VSEKVQIAATAPDVGEPLAGGWHVERQLQPAGEMPVLLVVDDVGDRAIAFVLDAGAADPPLDEERAARWGTLRRVLRDETWGRLVVDGIPEGELLTDWMAAGKEVPPAWIDQLGDRLRADHRDDAWHGQLAADRIVVGDQELAVAGWGLGGDDDADGQRSRDLAALAALTGRRGAQESARSTGTVEIGPASPRMQAALAADHIPTLREALSEVEQALERGELDGEPAELARARDALQRLEAKATAQLESAERMITQGDPLGAVAACREAIRLGEEERAEPILKEARRQARRLLTGGERDAWRRWLFVAVGVAALAIVVVVGALWLMPGGGESPLEARLAELEQAGGRRAVVRWLAELEARGEGTVRTRELLATELQRLADEERARLLELRRRTVARGARPHRADRLAENGLATLAGLAAGDAGPAPTPAAIQQVLRDVDRAATRYRAATAIDTETAAAAVDRLLVTDPVFAGSAGGER
jgi:hypothetical protein